MLQGIGNIILTMFFPRRCPVCDGVLSVGTSDCCPSCRSRLLQVTEPKCRQCGKPVAETEEFCRDCQGKKSAFEYGQACFLYDGLMQESIGRFKYQGRREYASFYGKSLYHNYKEWIRELEPDAIVPVPIHSHRLRKRGYNQAALIGRSLSSYCHVVQWEDFLVRSRDTQPLKELDPAERLCNLREAFAIGESWKKQEPPERILLIDDIYTTGATVQACAQVMKAWGVRKIYVLCLAIGRGN